jgi:competence protein ComEA
MWQSLVIKLLMLAATVSMVLWMGWTVPITVPHPVPGDTQPVRQEPSIIASAPAVLTVPQQNVPVVGKKEQRKLDLNRASAQEFEELPGIGPVLAERIVAYRRGGKSFRTVEDLRAVKGIGRKKFEQVRPFVTVTRPITQTERGKPAA